MVELITDIVADYIPPLEYLTKIKNIIFADELNLPSEYLNAALKSSQSDLKIDANSLHISLQIISNSDMIFYNQQYRQKSDTTDVLSFCHYEGENNEIRHGSQPINWGDLLICHDVLLKQAGEQGILQKNEFLHLYIHGIFHLLGYDHERSTTEMNAMEKREEYFLNIFTT